MLLDLNSYPKNISLLFSGGADSSLLLYLCALNLEKDVTAYVIDRHNSPIPHAEKVHRLICERTNRDIPLQIVQMPKDILHQRQVPLASKIIQVVGGHDVLLWGVNKYPPDPAIRPKFPFNFLETSFLRFPFKDFTKDVLIQEFFNLGIQDILEATHSCGMLSNGSCGECFNCRERLWAYDAIGKTCN